MKLKDMKIGTQLKIGFSIIVILIITLGIISLRQTDRIADHIKDMYEHPFTVRYALGKLNTDITGMRLEFRDFILASNDSERQKTLTNSALYQEDAERNFEILRDRYLGPQDDVKEAHNAFIRWVELRKSNWDLAASGHASEAYKRVLEGDVGKELEHLVLSIDKIDRFASNKANDFLNLTVILNSSLNRQTGLLLSIILTLTMLIVYFINRNIRHPMELLINTTKRFMEGQISIRSTYLSKNEFGMLSASFNNLADTIETELILNKQSAQLAEVMLSESDAHLVCQKLLINLLEISGAQMGAIYLLNDQKTDFHHFESIGMVADKHKSFSASQMEGEFGTALASQKLQHIKGIPSDSDIIFSTVSSDYIPREIITLPIVSQGVTVAILSLFTISGFNNTSLRLLHSITNILNARIEGILAYQKIINFTHQLEFQNSELEVQKRELSTQTNELSEQNVELEMQKKQLDDANRMKTSFLSNMSHELRTPLNSIIALSGVLNHRLAGAVPAEEFGYLDVIERNGKILLSLINDILDLSRIESGYEEVEASQFNVTTLLEDVIEMVKPQADQKSIFLRLGAVMNHADIRSDFAKCRHILQNLVANAVKFTETGGVEITVIEESETIRIKVSDTGIGIDRNDIPYIFDEFRQADGSNSRKYGGTGLGLAIAKKYARMLNGGIEVESEVGKGSDFTLVLPKKITTDQYTREGTVDSYNKPIAEAIHINDGLDAEVKTILLVEDAEAIIVQLSDMLGRQGYNLMVARNGEEALEKIACKKPDGMILDLMMPGVDGFEVLKRIRDEEQTDHLPVIILTAKYVTKEELAFLKHNNIHQLIQKGDINKDQLLQAVSRMMIGPVHEQPAIVKREIATVSRNPVVLIVEDNPDNRITIKALLDDRCQVVEAEDGLKGIELAQLHHPDLILMDIALPLMNGIDALLELRKIEDLKNIPVIAVSASAMKGNKEELITVGFDDYISKPIDIALFKKKMAEYLNK